MSKASAIFALVVLFGSAACSNEGGMVGGGPQPSVDAAADKGSNGGQAGSSPGTGGAAGVAGNDAAQPPVDSGGGGGGGTGGADAGPRVDTGPTPTSDAGNPTAGPAGPWARAVRIGLVEVSQGVFVKVGDGNTVVAGAMRNAPIIEGRPMFARVHIATDAGFTARRLRAVLSLQYADNTKFELEDAKMISAASNVEQIASTFNFTVPAERVKPNTQMVASVYEATDTAMGAEPAMPPRFPATATADLAVKAGRMELWVVIVPNGMVMDTPERRKKLENDLFDLYPVQKVNLRVREAVVLDGAFSSSKGFAALERAREMDNAKPYEYYHMITTASAGYAGIGRTNGPSAMEGARRIAITVGRNTIDGNTNTTAHEIGHNHGRPHAPGCGAAGPDSMYPYTMPAGDMGVNGYSLSTSTFKSRMMFRELMSYCRPRWISDYMWKRFEERVRIITSYAGAPMMMDQMMSTRSLQGFIGPDETAPHWSIVAGQLVSPAMPATPERYALLRLADGRQVMMPVSVEELTDHETKEWSINLGGVDFVHSDVIEAEVFVDGIRSLVPVGGMYRR